MTRVSVVMPVYNGERYVAESVANVLASDDDDFELVILDNASTDATPRILAGISDPRVRIHRNEHVLSLPDNWRAATDLAEGRYVKVVCHDDLIRHDALRRQAELLDRHPDVAIVVSRRHFIDDDGRVLSYAAGLPGLIGRHPAQAAARRITWLGINPLGESAAIMFRKADYDAVGGWRGDLVYPMDADLWLRLLARGDMIGEPEALAAFRISRGSLTSRHDDEQFREQADFVSEVSEDPQWDHSRPAQWASRQITKLGWYAWTWRHRYWTSSLLGAPRRLGEPAPLLRRLLP